MSARSFALSLCLLSAVLSACAAPSPAATADPKSPLPMSLEEISSKRKALREQLMLPSLSGIKTISYRVVGYKNYEPLEKIMGSKLDQLSIQKSSLMKSKDSPKPFDALVQITFSKSGLNTIAELKVIQWVSLVRNPKITCRATTYDNKLYLQGNKPEQAVEQLTNEFVIDFLKANQKSFDAEKTSAAPTGTKTNAKK